MSNETQYSKSKELGYDYLNERNSEAIYEISSPEYILFNEKFNINEKEKFLNTCSKFFDECKKDIEDYFVDCDIFDDIDDFDNINLHDYYDHICFDGTYGSTDRAISIYLMKYETEDEYIARKEKLKQAKALSDKKKAEAKAKRELKKTNPAKALVEGLTPEMKEAIKKELLK